MRGGARSSDTMRCFVSELYQRKIDRKLTPDVMSTLSIFIQTKSYEIKINLKLFQESSEHPENLRPSYKMYNYTTSPYSFIAVDIQYISWLTLGGPHLTSRLTCVKCNGRETVCLNQMLSKIPILFILSAKSALT